MIHCRKLVSEEYLSRIRLIHINLCSKNKHGFIPIFNDAVPKQVKVYMCAFCG